MEIKKEEEEDIRKIVSRITRPIFDKVLQEAPSNSRATTKKAFKYLWRPHNYRRQINVKIKSNSTIQKIKSAITTTDFNYCPHTKMVSVKNYHGITIQYGKCILTGIFSQNIIDGNKETYLIEAYKMDDIQKRIDMKKEEIQIKIDNAIEMFSKQFGIGMQFEKPGWSKHGYEDWIKGEEYIDSIPREVIIHDTFFKKVYEKGIEFIPTDRKEEPTVHMKNYIKTRAYEDVSPEVADEMRKSRELIEGILETNASTSKVLSQFVSQFLPIQADFATNIKTHTKVLKGIDKSFRKFNRLLTNKEKQKQLGEFIG